MTPSRCTTGSDFHFLAFLHVCLLCPSVGEVTEMVLDGFRYCRQGAAIREVEDS